MDWDALIPHRQTGTPKTAQESTKNALDWEQFPPKTGGCSHLGGGGKDSNINALDDMFPLFPLFPPPETRLGLEGQEKHAGGAGRPDQIRARKGGSDDRRTCKQCLNLEDRSCIVARPGGVVSARRWYEPVADILQRCPGYRPSQDDPNQRLGTERWPGLWPRAHHQSNNHREG